MKFGFSEVGIGRATTFHGFCARHDRDLFSYVENKRFDTELNQCFALAYRTVAYEVHPQAGTDQFFRGMTRQVPARHAVGTQAFAASMLRGHQAARDGILLTAARFSALLPDGAMGGVEHLVIGYDGVLPFAFAGAFAPMWDFEDHEFQSLRTGEATAGYLALNTVTAADRSHVILSWLTEAAPQLRTLLRQIQDMPLAMAGRAVLEMALEGVGTLVFSPSWVKALDPGATTALERLHTRQNLRSRPYAMDRLTALQRCSLSHRAPARRMTLLERPRAPRRCPRDRTTEACLKPGVESLVSFGTCRPAGSCGQWTRPNGA